MLSHVQLDGRVLVLEPSGPIVGGPETDDLVNTARESLGGRYSAIVVDLQNVEFMNSLGLGAFARILVSCSRDHGTVKVCNLRERVRALFNVTKLCRLFEFYLSESEALEALAGEVSRPA
jgi:anti-sigma B factor antagonist